MRVAIAIGFVLVCLAGRVAWAEDAAAAREHSQKGITYYKLAKYDDAIREFESAYEAKADPALLYNLAQCHRLAGHDNEALRLYRNYLRDAPRGPYHAEAEDQIKALERSIAERPASAQPVTPAPEAPPQPAVEPAPAPLAVTPGQPGPGQPAQPPMMPPQPVPGAYPPGATEPLQNVMPGPPLAPAQPPAAAHSGRRTAGVVLASIGGVFLIGGAVCGLAAKADAKKVEDAAANHDQFDPSVEKAGRAAELLQWIGYGVGAASAALGLILYATAPSAAAETAPAGRVALAPLAGPGLGGALMRVAF